MVKDPDLQVQRAIDLLFQTFAADNDAEYLRRQSRGAPRKGAALLQGLLYCGVCGRKVGVLYRSAVRHVCQSRRSNASEPICFCLLGAPIDNTPSSSIAMQDGYGQALNYARTLAKSPPFLVVADIGY